MRFFNFPDRGEAKKHPWDRILRGLFHATILGGLFQAAQNAGVTKVVELRSKRVFSTFPIGKRRITLRSEKTALGSILPILVLYHHFGWAFASRVKSRVDEGRPIPFKTRFFDFPHYGETKNHPGNRNYQFRFHTTIFAGLLQALQKAGLTKVVQLRWKLIFFDFPHRCETKKHPWDRIPRGRFHTTIFGGLLQAAQKAGLTKFVQLRWKLVFSSFPIGGIEKTPLGSNSTRSVSYYYFGWAFPSSEKRRVDEGRPIAFKTRFSTFAITAKRRITLGIEFTNFGFIPPFLVGFPKHRKKPGWRRSSDCGQNSLIRLSPSGESKKHPWDRIPRGRFHITILVGLLQAVQKARLTKSRQ